MSDDPFNFEHVVTVGKLRELLAGLPDDMPVIIDKATGTDGDCSPLASVEEVLYYPDSTWSGETFHTPEKLAELIAGGGGWSQEDAAPDDAVRALELGPVN